MKNLAIIQARTGSTRLPGKVLIKIEGVTVLEHVISRVLRAKLVDDVLVATTNLPEDDIILKIARGLNVRSYSGEEKDVLDRYYQASKNEGADNIVRITADCPMIDPGIIDMIIGEHMKVFVDYTSNTLVDSFPDGEDVEVFSFEALKSAWNEALLMSEREHVTPYIKKHKELFKQNSIISKIDYSTKRWTLDTEDDLRFIETIFKALYKEDNYFGMDKILTFLRDNIGIERNNSHIIRNEGYLKSLIEDKDVLNNG